MSRVLATIAAARRRALLADLADSVGKAMVWGAGVGAALVVVDRLIGLDWHWAALLGAPAAVGVAWGAARAYARRAGPLAAAGMVDDALALHDRLTNGLTLAAARGQDPAFVELALRESDRAAAAAEPRRAIAVRFGRAWQVWPALLALGVATGIFAPSMDLLGREEARQRSTLELARRDRVAAQLAAAVEAVRPAATAPAESAAAEADWRSAELERIREELEQGRLSPQDAAARAVQELEEMAERAQREAEAAASRQRATLDALAGLPRSARPEAAPESAPPDKASESALTRAVREGDLAAAREAANELLRPHQKLDPAQREQLAEDLRRLAEDLEQLERQEAGQAARSGAAPQREESARAPESVPRDRSQREPDATPNQDRSDDAAPTEVPQRQSDEQQQMPGEQTRQGQREQPRGEQSAEESRREQNSGEQPQQSEREQTPGRQIDRQGKPGERSQQGAEHQEPQRVDPEQLQRELEREGMSPEDARRAAEQIAERSQREAAQQASRDQRRELAQRLRDAAQSLKPDQEPPTQTPPQPTTDRPPQTTPPPTGEPAPAEQPMPDEQQPAPQPSPGEQPKPDERRPNAEGQPRQTPGQQTPEGRNVPQETSPQQTDRQPQGDPSPAGDRDDPGDIPEPTPQAIERLAEHLQRMARDGERQRHSAESARRAREQAEQIARGLSDDQRKRLEQWAEALTRQRPEMMEELARQSAPREGQDQPPGVGDWAGTGEPRDDGRAPSPTPGPRRTEIVDARPRESAGRGSERDQVVAEWLAPPREGDAPSAVAPRERLLEAARSAQKAVDDRAIPSRYDRLVQRYFRRLPERVEEAAAERPGPSGRTLP